MKERDSTYPKWITKTKSKRYVAICPVTHSPISGALQFRIQASQALQHHLKQKHGLTMEQAKEQYS